MLLPRVIMELADRDTLDWRVRILRCLLRPRRLMHMVLGEHHLLLVRLLLRAAGRSRLGRSAVGRRRGIMGLLGIGIEKEKETETEKGTETGKGR